MAEVDLEKYLRVLWRWSWLIALSAIAAAGAGYYATQFMPRMYRTSTTVLVGENTVRPDIGLDDIQISLRASTGYLGLVKRQPVMDGVVKALGLRTDWRELQSRVVASRSGDGQQLIEIAVVDSQPERARAIADEIARQLILQSPAAEAERQMAARRDFVSQQLDTLRADITRSEQLLVERQNALKRETSARAVLDIQDEIKGIENKIGGWRSTYAQLSSSDQRRSATSLSVFEPAYLPTSPVTPNVRANVLMAAAIGVLLGVIAAILIEYVSDTLRTSAEVVGRLGLPTLASIGTMARARRGTRDLAAVVAPFSAAAESYRVLRTNIQFARLTGQPTPLLITSPGPREGKSLTSANLAVSFAQSGKRTILVDADLRFPKLHTFFDCPHQPGLSSLFLDLPDDDDESAAVLRDRLSSMFVTTEIPGLTVLPAGPVPPNPAELLASHTMEVILRTLESMADVVILDSPPILAVADASILAGHDTSVVLVIRSGKTSAQAARLAAEAITGVQGRLLGAVVNGVKRAPFASYGSWRLSSNTKGRLDAAGVQPETAGG